MTTSSDTTVEESPGRGLNWAGLTDKEAKTIDGSSLGEVKQVAEDYVYTEKGTVKKEKYYVPKRFADRFDGKTLWFSITKSQAEGEFKRENPPGRDEYAKKYRETTVTTGPSGETKDTLSVEKD
jgi:hypothetical protein